MTAARSEGTSSDFNDASATTVAARPSQEGSPIAQAVVQRAAEWMARLWSGSASEAEVAACAAWRAEDPDHDHAWNRLQQLEYKLDGVPRNVARGVLIGPQENRAGGRRRVLQILGVAALAGGTGLLLRESDTWFPLAYDERTAVGEIRAIALPDGTHVVLDTASAIDVYFTDRERRIVLRAGAILVTSAPHSAVMPRPLLVQTREGLVQAIGTRFSVQQDDDLSHVAVFDGAVELRPKEGTGTAVRLGAGQRSGFTRADAQPVEAVDASAAAWSQGMLVVERMRLADFVAELGRYRRGVVRCHESVADLRVTGVFSLRDTDRSLSNLTLGLPVDVSYRTRFWVTVHHRVPGDT